MAFELEICAYSVASCIAAENGGATRIELCMGKPEGGTTPSAGLIYTALKAVRIPIHVIIRPRGGDFCYSQLELAQMEYDIKLAKQLGAAGVVFGCLTPEGEYDHIANQRLLDAACGMQVTFHRAFDMCNDQIRTLNTIINAGGFTRILTSGGQENAIAGTDKIKTLVELAKDNIGIMVGCGITPNNIKTLAETTKATMFHGSLSHKINSKMQFRKPNISMGSTVFIDEYHYDITSSEQVTKTIAVLREIF